MNALLKLLTEQEKYIRMQVDAALEWAGKCIEGSEHNLRHYGGICTECTKCNKHWIDGEEVKLTEQQEVPQ
jgi:hypothetical protein